MKVLVLGLGSWSLGLGLGLEHLVLVLVSVLNKKVLQFFKTFVVILDGSEQGTPWHFCERQQKQFAIWKPLFERTFCAQCTSASVEMVFNNVAVLGYTDSSKAQCIDCGKLFHSVAINQESKLFMGWNVIQKNATKISIHCTWGKWNPVNNDHLQKRQNWTRYWRRIVGLTWWLNGWKGKKH